MVKSALFYWRGLLRNHPGNAFLPTSRMSYDTLYGFCYITHGPTLSHFLWYNVYMTCIHSLSSDEQSGSAVSASPMNLVLHLVHICLQGQHHWLELPSDLSVLKKEKKSLSISHRSSHNYFWSSASSLERVSRQNDNSSTIYHKLRLRLW